MNHNLKPHHRAVAVLLSATALIATPVIAQEATAPSAQSVAPPQVVPTVPDSSAAARQAEPAAAQVGDTQGATPVNPVAAEQAAAEEAERRTERRTARPAAARIAPRVASTRPTATPAATQSPAAVTPTPAPVAAAPAPAATPPAATPATPAATAQDTATTPEAAPVVATRTETTTTETGGTPIWPLALIGLAIVALGAFFFLRRRNAVDDDGEQVYVEQPVAQEAAPPMTIEPVAAAPVAAAPVAAAPAFLDRTPIAEEHAAAPVAPAVPEDATVETADDEDVAALTAAAPVRDRPWLELAMRPVRAGTNVDEALVEIELTVGNAGAVRAEDVRISTFMLENDDDGEVERLLVRPTDTAVEPVSIEPGEGTRVDATLAMQKAGLTGSGFHPIIVANARYRLPNGSEGRTSASFLIGVSADGGTALTPIQTARPQMRDDVEAQLYGEPQHA